MAVNTCKHAPCSCQVQDRTFCSDRCSEASRSSGEGLARCDCGHDQCRPHA